MAIWSLLIYEFEPTINYLLINREVHIKENRVVSNLVVSLLLTKFWPPFVSLIVPCFSFLKASYLVGITKTKLFGLNYKPFYIYLFHFYKLFQIKFLRVKIIYRLVLNKPILNCKEWILRNNKNCQPQTRQIDVISRERVDP